jgi:hypothetical protein
MGVREGASLATGYAGRLVAGPRGRQRTAADRPEHLTAAAVGLTSGLPGIRTASAAQTKRAAADVETAAAFSLEGPEKRPQPGLGDKLGPFLERARDRWKASRQSRILPEICST